jgi:hypothetical protein
LDEWPASAALDAVAAIRPRAWPNLLKGAASLVPRKTLVWFTAMTRSQTAGSCSTRLAQGTVVHFRSN